MIWTDTFFKNSWIFFLKRYEYIAERYATKCTYSQNMFDLDDEAIEDKSSIT